MEFTHTAGLRTVIAEHRADVEKLRQAAVAIELILQIGTYRRSRILGTQRDAAVTAVGEGIHFLVHHIGTFADAAMEQFRMLEHRRTDFLVAVTGTQVTDFFFHIGPLSDGIGQYILCPSWGIG